MMWNKDYSEELEKAYKKIYSSRAGRPQWGVKKNSDSHAIIHPAIPFVGKDYDKSKLLAYASAENLNWYKKGKETYLDDDEAALIRRRSPLKSDKKEKCFFPGLNMGPFGNGYYYIIIAYVLKKLEIELEYETPFDFLYNFAADNFGKFSIAGDENEDYAGKIDYLRRSFKYVEADLETLKPNIIIMPKTIYNFDEVKALIKGIVPESKIISIYQMQPHNIINEDRIAGYPKRKGKKIIEPLSGWHDQITKNKEQFYSIYAYLDSVLNDIKKEKV
jgi:hypothetical protein